MRYFLIGLIKLYQLVPGPWHNYCRHIPSCSNYAILALCNYGLFTGCLMSIKRILRCNPFNSCGYDPVKKKEG